jgi:hypothetical protein
VKQLATIERKLEGISIHNCKILAASDLAPVKSEKKKKKKKRKEKKRKEKILLERSLGVRRIRKKKVWEFAGQIGFCQIRKKMRKKLHQRSSKKKKREKKLARFCRNPAKFSSESLLTRVSA